MQNDTLLFTCSWIQRYDTCTYIYAVVQVLIPVGGKKNQKCK